MRISPALAAICFALSGMPALAWNDFGHMEVAALAWSKLTPAARQNATELLKLNPQYSHWTSGASADERDQIAFVMAATWPDFIKRESDYHSDGADDGDRPPRTAEASQNIGYADHYRHKYWHFVDEPFSPDRTALQPPDKPNAQTQIAALRTTLSDAGAMADVRSYDLVWLEPFTSRCTQRLASFKARRTATPAETASKFVAAAAAALKNFMPFGTTCSAQVRTRVLRSVLPRNSRNPTHNPRSPMRKRGYKRAPKLPRRRCMRHRSKSVPGHSRSPRAINRVLSHLPRNASPWLVRVWQIS